MNWLRARPWQVYPLWPTGWRYHVIYREARRGAWWRDRWIAEPVGRVRALWRAMSFPHVHDEGPD